MDAGALEEAIAGCEWAAADHRRVGLSVVVMQGLRPQAGWSPTGRGPRPIQAAARASWSVLSSFPPRLWGTANRG